jgi:pimeloyl-ACP methyl ester carboxylesterase
LETLETLAVDRPIVFYDQLGRGKSDRPDDPSRWRIDRFVAEVGAVRRGLGLEKVHVLGHSWGGWLMQFMQRHLCRLDPWPDALERSGRNIEGTPVYEAMFGPNEFTVTGNLKEWDRTDRLHEIAVPTLITCGRSEGAGPSCAATLQRGIAGSRLQVFEHSTHMAHLEEPEEYARIIREFLRSVEREGMA